MNTRETNSGPNLHQYTNIQKIKKGDATKTILIASSVGRAAAHLLIFTFCYPTQVLTADISSFSRFAFFFYANREFYSNEFKESRLFPKIHLTV